MMVTYGAMAASPARTLSDVELDVAARYHDVAQVESQQMLQQIARKSPLVLIDVREAQEYAVSHLPGAVRVDPDASAAEVLAALGPVQPGSQIAKYCSVGVRSSRLAERSQKLLQAQGAMSVSNLRGGIFRWHADRRPLVDARGPTDAIHGFDRRWSKLIPRHDAPIVVSP